MDYFDWVEKYPNYVVLEKEGTLYKGTGNAAYVLNDLLNYPLSTGEYGHVVAAGDNLENIIDVLSKNKINYLVIEDGKIALKKLYDDSDYSPYVITNYIKNNVEKHIKNARTGFENKKAENSDVSSLKDMLKKLAGMKVSHKNESLGDGFIEKAYLSENGEIYTDIRFTSNNEVKSFMFIYCAENEIIKLSDDRILKDIKELYSKVKK